jgi:DNA polymerase-4
MEKPDGLVFVPRGQEARFLAPLPVRAIPGIGPKAEEALQNAGIQAIAQLAQAERGGSSGCRVTRPLPAGDGAE